jgi:hypothetical protein
MRLFLQPDGTIKGVSSWDLGVSDNPASISYIEAYKSATLGLSTANINIPGLILGTPEVYVDNSTPVGPIYYAKSASDTANLWTYAEMTPYMPNGNNWTGTNVMPLLEPGTNQWAIQIGPDGVTKELYMNAATTNMCTRKAYFDHLMEFDVRFFSNINLVLTSIDPLTGNIVAPNRPLPLVNTGVAIRGRYEFQVTNRDDSYSGQDDEPFNPALTLPPFRLYGQVPAKIPNLANYVIYTDGGIAPYRKNSVKIWSVGRKFSMELNGQMIYENETYDQPTSQAMDYAENRPGRTVIQGDKNRGFFFSNMKITPILPA